MAASARNSEPSPPTVRRLQVFAFDPGMQLELDLETARLNRALLEIRWEDVKPGPVGEYVKVVDRSDGDGRRIPPVDLDHPYLLAEHGYAPSEGNLQFHQQMVYAVAMSTIANFEQALGRSVHWSPRRTTLAGDRPSYQEKFVRRLRIYPHGLWEANAYYSPERKAILFGSFPATNPDARQGLPNGIVYTCLSYDVIVHEMTHAILDGIHRRMIEPTNEDSLAFHEAFADLIAIFQHFTLPGVLEHQIQKTRGDLSTENLLAKLAVEFGRATETGPALRDALGNHDDQGRWQRNKPDPARLQKTFEPHERGTILVAAVFDAFLTLYQSHTADLLRIASGGTGILAHGALHPDLVGRLAEEARRVAQRVCNICIRALDYLPPVDVTFGDYLRGMITADVANMPDDRRNYRTAIIRAFRDRGLFPRDVETLSEESLQWCPPTPREQRLLKRILPALQGIRLMANAQSYSAKAERLLRDWDVDSSESEREITAALVEAYSNALRPPRSGLERKLQWRRERQFCRYLHGVLLRRTRELAARDLSIGERLSDLVGIDFCDPRRKFEVHAVRPCLRRLASGQTKFELLVLITQRSLEELTDADSGETLHYRFRSGCTLLIDPIVGVVNFCIVKRSNSQGRRDQQRDFLRARLAAEGMEAHARYGLWSRCEQDAALRVPQEPFCIAHRPRFQGGDDARCGSEGDASPEP